MVHVVFKTKNPANSGLSWLGSELYKNKPSDLKQRP